MFSKVTPYIFLAHYRYVPESPRWLIQKGRITEAMVILTRIAEFNRKPVPDLLKLSSCVQVSVLLCLQ